MEIKKGIFHAERIWHRPVATRRPACWRTRRVSTSSDLWPARCHRTGHRRSRAARGPEVARSARPRKERGAVARERPGGLKTASLEADVLAPLPRSPSGPRAGPSARRSAARTQRQQQRRVQVRSARAVPTAATAGEAGAVHDLRDASLRAGPLSAGPALHERVGLLADLFEQVPEAGDGHAALMQQSVHLSLVQTGATHRRRCLIFFSQFSISTVSIVILTAATVF